VTAFALTGGDLHGAAQWALRAVPSRPTTPILGGLLVEAVDDDRVTITGYDFDTRASVTVSADVSGPGRMVVSGRLLADVAKTIRRDATVSFTESGSLAEVRCGRSEWTLPALPAHDYPQLPQLGEPVGAVQAGVLRSALARILPTLDYSNPSLPMLYGVKLESDGDELTLIGTDRFRLAAVTSPWHPAVDVPVDLLAPGTLLDVASKATGGDSELVGLSCSDTGFGLASDTHLVTGRLLDAVYPRWRPFLAQTTEHHATVVSGDLLQAVEQALIAADTDSRQVQLSFDGDTVSVSASGGVSRARAEVAAEMEGGDAITVTFRAAYVKDAIASCESEQVTLRFGSTPLRPILFEGGDTNYRHSVMPVRPSAVGAVAA
jgi:DNA polymerase-3 subunit beta